jgi:iron complex transport system substrate-binding protein
LISALEARIANIESVTSLVTERPRIFCIKWMEPPMAGGHWIPEMIRLAGGTDNLGREEKPSTAIEWELVLEFDPQVIVLMPCGYKIARTLGEVDKLAPVLVGTICQPSGKRKSIL